MSVAIGIPHIMVSAEVNKLYSFLSLWILPTMCMNTSSLLRNQLYYMYVPEVGSIVCTCTSGCMVVLCVHVFQVGSIVCTCTSGW